MSANIQVFDGTRYRTVVSVPGGPSYPTTDQDAVPRSVGDTAAGTAAVTDWDDGWRNATYTNSWRTYGNGYSHARYRRIIGGLVVIEGLVSNGTVNTPFFYLPVGYRPSDSLVFATYCNNFVTRLQIRADGAVFCPYSGTTGWHSVECSFFADDWEHA